MHEVAVTEALLEQVRRFSPEEGTLLEVRIEVGALEHLDPDAMRTVWAALVEGTAYEGATLAIDPVPLLVVCRACGTSHSPEDPAVLICPDCGAARPEVRRGSGVVLRSLEVETEEGT
jgi:hydrogenase nickel incorporation protein HypA/HybF